MINLGSASGSSSPMAAIANFAILASWSCSSSSGNPSFLILSFISFGFLLLSFWLSFVFFVCLLFLLLFPIFIFLLMVVVVVVVLMVLVLL